MDHQLRQKDSMLNIIRGQSNKYMTSSIKTEMASLNFMKRGESTINVTLDR